MYVLLYNPNYNNNKKKKFRVFRVACLGSEMSFRHLYKICWLSEVLTLATAAGVGKICGCPDI